MATKPDNMPLPNLPTFSKLLYSLCLILGLSLFAGSWAYVLVAIYWPGLRDPGIETLGVALGTLAAKNYQEYYKALALHAFSLILLLSATLVLYRKISLRRKFKALIRTAAIAFVVIDLSAWYHAPTCSASNLYVGVAGILSALPLLMLGIVPLYQMWIYKRWKNPSKRRVKVVFIGGGFAGLYAALGLNKKLGYHQDLEITLIDRRNYFLFPPLLPSAAAGTIETRQVSYPFRRIFETTNISFKKVTVIGIDPQAGLVRGLFEASSDPVNGVPRSKCVEFPFDYLVLAPGSTTQTFGTPGADRYAFFMRELNDAVRLRNHVIDCFERAAVVQSVEEKRELLSFFIVGAGPTGIETATEIHDLIKHVLLKRYPEIDPLLPQVYVAQSGEDILPGWPKDIREMTLRQLNKMSIQVLLESRVSEIGPQHVILGKDRCYATRTVVWAAGVKAPEFLRKCGLPLNNSGRVEVEHDLRAIGHKNIFVLGDAASLVDQRSGKPLPPLGQVAFQQGSHTAANLARLLCGAEAKPFKYFDFGGLISVGEHFAAVNLLGVRVKGFIGWVIWRSLYLVKLVGFSNKIRVALDWTLDLLIERSISQIRDESNSELNPAYVGDGTSHTHLKITAAERPDYVSKNCTL